jgi:hypothetical protein
MLLADDRGKVCATQDLDYYTGCCRTGQTHACDKCSKHDSCCASFEHCVSCCLDPANSPDTRRLEAPRWSGNPEDSRVWAGALRVCVCVCARARACVCARACACARARVRACAECGVTC